MAVFLTRLRPLLAEATATRHAWVHDIGVLLEDARHSSSPAVAQRAGKIGRTQVALFRDVRIRAGGLEAPPSCASCHRSVLAWLDKQIGACDVMVGVGTSGDLAQLREVQGILAEARAHARSFNGEYARLVEELRATTRAAHQAARAAQRRSAAKPAASATS